VGGRGDGEVVGDIGEGGGRGGWGGEEGVGGVGVRDRRRGGGKGVCVVRKSVGEGLTKGKRD